MDEPLDNATRERLAKLASTPVDLSRLECALEAEVESVDLQVERYRFTWRSAASLAACLAIAATLWIWFSHSGHDALRMTPELMSQMHDEVLRGESDTIQVSSIAAAQDAVRSQWTDAPRLPDFAVEQVESCCIHTIDKAKAICILGRVDGVAITMLVAHESDMQPHGSMSNRGYRFDTAGSRGSLSVKFDDRCVCLIADLPESRLVAIAQASGLIP